MLGVNDLPVRERVIVERLARSAADDLKGGVHIDDFEAGSIEHPEDFLDIVRHLPELLFAVAQGLEERLIDAGNLHSNFNRSGIGGVHIPRSLGKSP